MPERDASLKAGLHQASADQLLAAGIAGRLRPAFRGEIWEHARTYRLAGSAYASMPPEQGGVFRIESAAHLRGPLRALRDPAVRLVILIGAVQTLKSLVGNLWLMYLLEHAPADTLVLFETDEKAASFALQRIMPVVREHPHLLARLKQEADSRHDITRTKIITPSMTLTCQGLKESAVSSFAWQNIWVSEAWRHGTDGLLPKALKRADRYSETCKILIESQPGDEQDDLFRLAMQAHQVHLTWACPYCEGRQSWETTHEFGILRPEDFQPRPVLHEPPPADAPAGPPAPGSYAGMKWPAAEETSPGGETRRRTIQERAAAAWWECYWCGCALRDTPEMRAQLAATYEQDYQVETVSPSGRLVRASPRAVCFWFPFEVAATNRFARSVATYLAAKDAARLGNRTPLRDWYVQERGRFWTDRLVSSLAPFIATSAAVPAAERIPDEVCRVLGVDAQQHDALTLATGRPATGCFWAVARAMDRAGNLVQLARAWLSSWDELVALQDRLQISNENVGIDASFFHVEIVDTAARHVRAYQREIIRHGRRYQQQVLHTWTLLQGDSRGPWRWPDGRYRDIAPPRYETRNIQWQGGTYAIRIPVFFWRNLGIKDMLSSRVAGGPGLPSFTVLPRSALDSATQLRETGELAYEAQMTAEQRTADDHGKPCWRAIRRDNHYWDCECMCLVLLGLAGLLGGVVTPEAHSPQPAA